MKTNITLTISPETHPNLYNLLTLPEVTDPIIVEDLDAGETIDVTDIINAIRAELGV